ncbi:hypothetical protein D3C77_366920 [compost metagenome]
MFMSYQLTNGKLAVEIASLGDYSGARFDWTGFITKIELLDGHHSYCVPESVTQSEGSGGIGLCNEFGLSQALNYEHTLPQQQFPKIGVGLLTKPDDQDYAFNHPYLVDPYEVIVEQISPAHIKFVSMPKSCEGYAFQLEKNIVLSENKLSIEYQLSNVGQSAIRTTEYCHNFVGIDNHLVSDEYVLRFPFQIEPKADDPATIENIIISREGSSSLGDADCSVISWKQPVHADFYFRADAPTALESSWLWELIHQPSGVGVRETSQFPLKSIALWGRKHVISPETFIEIEVLPGEVSKWTRSYDFFNK